MTVLAGDIGATTTRLALVSAEGGPRKVIAQQSFASADYKALQPVVSAFLAAHTGARPTSACFDVAGPVINGCAHLTNLPWDIEVGALEHDLGLAQVDLLNDLHAIAYAVPHLLPEEMVTLNVGKPVRQAPISVLAPGTGLGEAFLIWSGADYIACSSEGGHADFAPTNQLQAGLWEYLPTNVCVLDLACRTSMTISARSTHPLKVQRFGACWKPSGIARPLLSRLGWMTRTIIPWQQQLCASSSTCGGRKRAI
jgi:glucokinase